jgi:hypothetical protein
LFARWLLTFDVNPERLSASAPPLFFAKSAKKRLRCGQYMIPTRVVRGVLVVWVAFKVNIFNGKNTDSEPLNQGDADGL